MNYDYKVPFKHASAIFLSNIGDVSKIIMLQKT
jgi:hypothetical protein